MTKFKNKYRIEPARLEGYDYSLSGMYFITICTGNRKHHFGEIINGEMHLSEIGKIANDEWYKTLGIRKDMNLQLHGFVVMPNHIHGIIEIGDNIFNHNFIHDGRDAMLGVSHKDDNFGVDKNVGNEDDVIRYGDAKHRVFTKDDDINRDFSRDAIPGVSHKDDNFGVDKNVGNEEDVIRYGDAKHRVFTKDDDINRDFSRDAMPGVSHKDDNFGVDKNVGNEDDVICYGDAKHRVSTTMGDVEKMNNLDYKNTFSSQSKNIASIMRGYKSAVTINARRVEDKFSWQTRFHDHVIRDANAYLRISNYIIANPENWKEDRYF